MLLTGDINLANVTDPTKPFALVADRLHAEDVVFGNLEGCLSDVIDPYHYMSKAGWRNAGAAGAPALRLGGFDAVGCANNVTFGREAILESLAVLDELGVPHTGAGHDLTSARKPVVLERNGTRYGFLQYTSVFWPIGHQASDARRVDGSDPLEKRYDDRAGLPDAPLPHEAAVGVASHQGAHGLPAQPSHGRDAGRRGYDSHLARRRIPRGISGRRERPAGEGRRARDVAPLGHIRQRRHAAVPGRRGPRGD